MQDAPEPPETPDTPEAPTPSQTRRANRPLPLSVSIVCMNNEATIGRCVDSVLAIASEVVAVDSGSTDGTIGVLERAGARVVHQDFLGHVRQKQRALDLCAQPWVLHLDSDESVEPELAASIRAAIERDDPSIDAFAVNRRVWWAGKRLDHAWQPEWRVRLVRAGKAAWGGHDPHDKLEPSAPRARVGRLRGVLRHDSIPTITAFFARQASHARIAAESYERMGRRGSVAKLVTSPVGAWLKQVVVRQAWRDGWRGWAAASATAAAAMMKHAALLERTRPGREDRA